MMDTTLATVFISATVSAGTIALTHLRHSMFDPDGVIADYQAVRIIKKLLNHNGYVFRSFARVRHHIGGYEDDQLRRLLVRAGAIRVMSGDGRELWVLLRRVKEAGGSANDFPWKLEAPSRAPFDAEMFPAKLTQIRADASQELKE